MKFFQSLDVISNPNPCYVDDTTAAKFFKNKEYVVIWYGRIYLKSNRSNAIKLIEVIFLDILSGYQLRIKLPIEIALKVTIGSIWVNGKTHYKYDLDDFSTLIEAKSENLLHSNHFWVSETNRKAVENNKPNRKVNYEFDVSKYPVNGLDKDTNTLLVIRQGDYKIIIHPLTFFVAHYGVSKEINRILLSYLFTDVEGMLNLNKPDPKTSDIVLIPDNCVIGDAVFLHHLKHDNYTKSKVKTLNDRVIQKFSELEDLDPQKPKPPRSASLKCEPYHEQPIEMTFEGFEIDAKVILCTLITGMSMPQGDDISYAFEDKQSSKSDFDPSRLQKRNIKPLFHKIDSNEIVVEVEKNAGNSTIAVTRQRIVTIGEIRQLIKTENISPNQAIQSCNSATIPLNEPIPSTHAVGDKKGSDSSVGMLRALISSGVVNRKNLSFKRLLKYAQVLRTDVNYPEYGDMQIDCYTCTDGRFHGEVVDKLNNYNGPTNVASVYVLRIMTGGSTYYIFDCDMMSGIMTSGTAIKVDNDTGFRDAGVSATLGQLFTNNGRLRDQKELEVLYGSIKSFNHTNGKTTNWVRTAIDNLKKEVSDE